MDLLVCMTITPDTIIPSQACLIRARAGLSNAVAFDLNAACTGCIYGLEVATSMMESSMAQGSSEQKNPIRHAVIVGVERLSRIIDWTDRASCVLFGDGAGAVVLEWDEKAKGILSSFLKNTDDLDMLLSCDQHYDLSTFPFGDAQVETGSSIMWQGPNASHLDPERSTCGSIGMEGQQVFKWASSAMAEAAEEACKRGGISLEDVDVIIPHQANERIIRFAAKKLKVPMERFQVSIGSVGNTSASSVLMALTDAYDAGRVNPGDKVLLVGFGGGLTSGAMLLEA